MLHLRPVRRAALLAAWVLLVAVTHVSGPSIAFADLSAAQSRKLDPILRQAIERSKRGASITAAEQNTGPAQGLFAWPNEAGAQPRIPCWIHFDGLSALPSWLHAESSSLGRAHSRLSIAEIERLAQESMIERVVAAPRAKPLLDASLAEMGATWVHDGQGAPPIYRGYAGKGVVIGIVDTGLDLTHDDFRIDGRTRLTSLWDQTASTVNSPSGFRYGREWTAAQIDAGVSDEKDVEGHGTHVTGIAAGNGSASGRGKPAYRFVGMAPEATIIAVKTDFYTTSVVDAVAYIFDRAGALGLPAVVNLSLGHHFGPHDGTEDTDLAMAALSGPGRILVAAAGNEQELGIHAHGHCAARDSLELTFQVSGYAPRSGADNDYLLMDGYSTLASPIELSIVTPNGHVVGPIAPGEKVERATADGGVYLENGWMDPVTADREIFVQIYDPVASASPVSGTWTLRVRRVTEGDAAADLDLWLYQSTLDARFLEGVSDDMLVASPASSDSVIAVGAYVTKKSWQSNNGSTYQYAGEALLGDIAPFSSHGPRRDGALKPDVAAPGMAIGSALSRDAAIAEEYVLDDGVHVIEQGTSMAAPHVAGLVAMMLEAHGTKSKTEILRILNESARRDPHTSSSPNSVWGAGKADAIGATSREAGVVLSDVQISRDAEGTLLEWNVPNEAASLEFRVLRVDGDGNEEVVAEVGPGPHYVLRDSPLSNAREIRYWLLALQSGKLAARFGPYQPSGETRSRGFDFPPPQPNPTHDGVSGTIRASEQGEVRLELLDVSGRLVKRWRLQAGNAGQVEYRWDGTLDDSRRAPTGIYWLRASIESESKTHRVLLLRK